MLIGPKYKGGLELPDYDIVTKPVQCAWVKRMKKGIRKSHPFTWEGGPFSFDCDYDLCLPNLRNMLDFYIDILKAWFLGHARLVCTKITLEVVSCGIKILQYEENKYIGRSGILLG